MRDQRRRSLALAGLHHPHDLGVLPLEPVDERSAPQGGLKVLARDQDAARPVQGAEEFRLVPEGETPFGPGRGGRAEALYCTRILRLRMTSRHLAFSAAK